MKLRSDEFHTLDQEEGADNMIRICELWRFCQARNLMT